MAQRVEAFTVAVAARTLSSAPKVVPLRFVQGDVRGIEIVIPDGHCGLTGIRITAAKTPVLPETAGGWIISSGEEIKWPLADFIESGDWGAEVYNRDIYNHNFYVRFLIDEYVVGAAAAPPAGIAGTVPLGAEQIEGAAPGAPTEAPAGETAPPTETPAGEPTAPAEPTPAPAPEPAPAPAPTEPTPAPAAEPPPTEPAAPAEPQASEGAAAPPAPKGTPEPPPGESVGQQIAFYSKELRRLEGLVTSLTRQIRAHPRSPRAADWRIIVGEYRKSIAHMRRLLGELRRRPRGEPVHEREHKGPHKGAGRKGQEHREGARPEKKRPPEHKGPHHKRKG